MSEDRTTRRAIDAQVLAGVGVLCLAERNLGLAVAAAAGYAAVRVGHRSGAGLPLPRWAVNAGAIAAVGFLLLEVRGAGVSLVAAMGHFTVLLQGLLLAGERRGRDDAMLLVLGLVQVLAASVLSSTVLDGAAMMLWCAVGAAALMRLSLRAARERVRGRNAGLAVGGPGDGGGAAVFGASADSAGSGGSGGPILRVLGVGLCVASVVAAAVFVATPRRAGGPRAEASAGGGGMRGVGFATRVELGGPTPERVLDGPVLHATIRQGGDNLGSDRRHFLLRGMALDRYGPDTRSWTRSAALGRGEVLLRQSPGGGVRLAGGGDPAGPWDPGASGGPKLPGVPGVPGGEAGARPRVGWEVEAVQRGGRLGTLFLPTARMRAAAAPIDCRIPGARSLNFNPLDGRLQAVDPLSSEAYRATVSPLRDDALTAGYRRFVEAAPPRRIAGFADPGGSAASGGSGGGRRWLDWLRPGAPAPAGPVPAEGDAASEALRWEVQPGRVAELANHVLAAAGLPREPGAGPLPGDRRRVERLEHFLRSNFSYTLQNPPVPPGEDPVIDFLFERRAGHCELFAAGLVALSRSVGIPARVATGFRAGEFNAAGGYYVVRPEHAHAWAEAAMGVTEAGDPAGWTTFDATPPAVVQAEHRRGGPAWLRRLRHAFEHAEFTWVSRVVAFGPGTRERALAQLKAAAVALFSDRVGWTRWLPAGAGWGWAAAGGALLLSVGAGVLGVRLVRRERGARRRAALHPAAFERSRGVSGVLGVFGGARRVGFYPRLLDVLGRQGHERPPAQTPAAWAAGLAAADPDRFGGVPAVTEAFYRVRFGGERPGPEELRAIDAAIAAVAAGEPRRGG